MSLKVQGTCEGSISSIYEYQFWGGGGNKKISGSILKLRIIDSDWTGGTHLKKTVLVDRILLARDSFLFCY